MNEHAPRFFVGVLAYHWETKDKKLYPYDHTCPWEELTQQGYRLYRFTADLPWHDLAPPAGHAMTVAPEEENFSKDPLPEGKSLADYVFEGLSRIVARLLPGRIYAPDGTVGTHHDKNARTINITTRHGRVSVSVR